MGSSQVLSNAASAEPPGSQEALPYQVVSIALSWRIAPHAQSSYWLSGGPLSVALPSKASRGRLCPESAIRGTRSALISCRRSTDDWPTECVNSASLTLLIPHPPNVNREPTLLVKRTSGIRRRIASVKLVPEQCIGKTTSGFSSSSLSIVCSM